MKDGVILQDIKKLLGMDSEYDVFDLDTILGINTVFSQLQQLGVGPSNSFEVVDENEKWSDFFRETNFPENYGMVKSYVFMKVKLMFDPPSTSFALESYQKQIQELEWRLNVQAEGDLKRE